MTMRQLYSAERQRAIKSVTELFVPSLKSYFRSNSDICDNMSEIRLRALLPCSVTVYGTSVIIGDGQYPITLTHDELDTIFARLCGGSVYTHAETIREGFIVKDGVRIGIGGRTLVKNGCVTGFSEIDSLNIRLPLFREDSAESVLSLIGREGFERCGGILAVSPPGCGKTTFLRALARGLSRGISYLGRYRRFRVCLADERGELFNEEFFRECTVDRLEMCPKAFAVECATALLSPEVIVCDEIRSEQEAILLSRAISDGVVLVASCHGYSLDDVIKKPHIKMLFDCGAFGTVYSLNLQNSASGSVFEGKLQAFSRAGTP